MRNLDPDSAYHIKLAAKNEFGMGEFDQYHAAVSVAWNILKMIRLTITTHL